MLREIRPAILILVLLMLITGLAYPLAMTAIAGMIFPKQAQGSLIEKDGKVVDPSIGQSGPADAGNTPARTAKLEEKEGIFLVQDGKAVFKQVKTGIIGDSDIEMIEGVKDGDEIVIGSYRTLRTLKNEALLKIEAQGGKGSK